MKPRPLTAAQLRQLATVSHTEEDTVSPSCLPHSSLSLPASPSNSCSSSPTTLQSVSVVESRTVMPKAPAGEEWEGKKCVRCSILSVCVRLQGCFKMCKG